MKEVIRIGLDTSKYVFQVHGVDAAERAVLRKKLRRADVERFFAALPPTQIGLEACGAAHHWARVLQGLGHEVRLLPPQYVKPYVKGGKNDTADAEAICEAMSRPTMRFAPIRTAENQAELLLLGARELLVRQRTMLGQRSCATAPTGRTYDRKRPLADHRFDLAGRGPSTYGPSGQARGQQFLL